MRPRQNGRHFAGDIFECIFLNDNASVAIKISLKFVPKGAINNIPALVQIMAWRRQGDKPLSGPMMVSLPTQICVTRPQWVKVLLFVVILRLSVSIHSGCIFVAMVRRQNFCECILLRYRNEPPISLNGFEPVYAFVYKNIPISSQEIAFTISKILHQRRERSMELTKTDEVEEETT